MVNVRKLKGKIAENGLSIPALAKQMGIDRSTLYRKLDTKSDTLMVRDARKLAELLHLSMTEATDIF